MTKLHRLAPALLLAMGADALADDYRFEAVGSYARDQVAGNSIVGDPEVVSLAGTWYFAPVSTDGVPLSEAAYLGRASSVGAIAGRFELFDTHLYSQAARVSYYLPGTVFYGGAGVSRNQQVTAVSSTITQKEYFTRWFGELGIAPRNGLLLTTHFAEGGYDPNLTARHVGKLPNGHFYAGSVSLVDPDGGDTSFGLDFDYYLDDRTSLGVGYEDAGERFEVRGERFFSASWAVGVSAYTADGVDGFRVNVTWRH